MIATMTKTIALKNLNFMFIFDSTQKEDGVKEVSLLLCDVTMVWSYLIYIYTSVSMMETWLSETMTVRINLFFQIKF